MATTNGEKVTFRVGYIPVSGGILSLLNGHQGKGVKEFLYVYWQTTNPFFGRTTITFKGTLE